MEGSAMKPILYEQTEREFESNGIGVLWDSISCEVHEVRNGEFELELEYPYNGQWFNEIKEHRYVLAKPNDTDLPHAFRIYEIEKNTKDQSIKVKAVTITDDLNGMLVKAAKGRGTPSTAFELAKNNIVGGPSTCPYSFYTNINDNIKDFQYVLRNMQSVLSGEEGSLIDLWRGEIKRTNNIISFLRSRGKRHATTIRLGKNMESFKTQISFKGKFTAILPYAKYTKRLGNGNDQQEMYVFGNVVKSVYYQVYDQKNLRPVDFSSDFQNTGQGNGDQEITEAQVNAAARNYFDSRNPGCDVPSIKMSVDMTSIRDSNLFDQYTIDKLETINLCDSVDVWVPKWNLDVSLTVVELTYDVLNERIKSMVISNNGKGSTSYGDSLTTTVNSKVEQSVNNLVYNEGGLWSKIVNLTADGKNVINYQTSQPSKAITGDLWYKDMGDGKVQLNIWDGSKWKRVVDSDFEDDVNRTVANHFSEVENKIKESTKEANERATQALNKADSALVKISELPGTGEYNILKDKIGIYERIIGNNESDVKRNITGMVMTPEIFQTEVFAKGILGTIQNPPPKMINHVLDTTDFSGISIGHYANRKKINQNLSYDDNPFVTTRPRGIDSEILFYTRPVRTINPNAETTDPANQPLWYIALPTDISEIKYGEKWTISFEWKLNPAGNDHFSAATSQLVQYGLFDFDTGRWEIGPMTIDVGPNARRNAGTDYRKVISSMNMTQTRKVGKNAKFTIMYTHSSSLYFRNIMLNNGDVAPYSPINSVTTRVTQIAGSWAVRNLNSNNDVVSEINATGSDVRIKGSSIWLDGNTKIENAIIKDAHIANINAGKITAGSLDAAKVNVINLNASNIVTGTMSANYIRGGILSSQSGSLIFDLNRNYLTFNNSANIEFKTTSNAVFRKKGQSTGFIHFHDDTYGGVFVGMGVTSHNVGIESSNTSVFAGIRIFRPNNSLDQTEIYGDTIMLSHAFSTERNKANSFVFEATRLSKSIDMVRLATSVESLWRCWEHLNNVGWDVGSQAFINACWNERNTNRLITT